MLGKSLGEIDKLPRHELTLWRAYFPVRNDLREEAGDAGG